MCQTPAPWETQALLVVNSVKLHLTAFNGNSKGGGAFQKPIFLKGKHGTKMEFPGGMGGSN